MPKTPSQRILHLLFVHSFCSPPTNAQMVATSACGRVCNVKQTEICTTIRTLHIQTYIKELHSTCVSGTFFSASELRVNTFLHLHRRRARTYSSDALARDWSVRILSFNLCTQPEEHLSPRVCVVDRTYVASASYFTRILLPARSVFS